MANIWSPLTLPSKVGHGSGGRGGGRGAWTWTKAWIGKKASTVPGFLIDELMACMGRWRWASSERAGRKQSGKA